MSERTSIPAPIEALLRAARGNVPAGDERASTFARGLALGALVGAAIAGSAIWQRRHATPADAPARLDAPQQLVGGSNGSS